MSCFRGYCVNVSSHPVSDLAPAQTPAPVPPAPPSMTMQDQAPLPLLLPATRVRQDAVYLHVCEFRVTWHRPASPGGPTHTLLVNRSLLQIHSHLASGSEEWRRKCVRSHQIPVDHPDAPQIMRNVDLLARMLVMAHNNIAVSLSVPCLEDPERQPTDQLRKYSQRPRHQIRPRRLFAPCRVAPLPPPRSSPLKKTSLSTPVRLPQRPTVCWRVHVCMLIVEHPTKTWSLMTPLVRQVQVVQNSTPSPKMCPVDVDEPLTLCSPSRS